MLHDSRVNCDFHRCENVGEVRADREENPQVNCSAEFGEAEKLSGEGFYGDCVPVRNENLMRKKIFIRGGLVRMAYADKKCNSAIKRNFRLGGIIRFGGAK